MSGGRGANPEFRTRGRKGIDAIFSAPTIYIPQSDEALMRATAMRCDAMGQPHPRGDWLAIIDQRGARLMFPIRAMGMVQDAIRLALLGPGTECVGEKP